MNSVRVSAGPMPGSPCCMCMIRKPNHSKMTPAQAQAMTMLNIKIKVIGLVCTFCNDIISDISRFREKVINTQDQLAQLLEPMKKKRPTKPAAAPSDAQPLTAPTLAPNPGSSLREYLVNVDKQNETKRNCNLTVQSLNENAPIKNEIIQNKNISGSRNKTERYSVETELILDEDEVKIKIEPDLEDSLLIPTHYVSLKRPESNQIENPIHIEPQIKVEKINEVDIEIETERNEIQRSRIHNTNERIAEIKIKKMDAVIDDEPVEKQRNLNTNIKDKTMNAVIEIDGTKNINKIWSPEDIPHLRITNMAKSKDSLNQLIGDGPSSNEDKMDALTAIKSSHSYKEQRSYLDDWCTRKEMTMEEVRKKLEVIRNSEEFKSVANRCDPCVRKFTSKQQYDAHVKKFHNPALRHVCGACSARFPAAVGWERHYSVAHHYLHQCKLCSYETMQYFYFLKHYKTWHIVAGKKPAICPLCKRRVPATRLDAHLRVQHGVGAKEEGGYCPECDVTFKTEALYQLHLKNSIKHNSRDNMAFECHDCGKKAHSKGSLRTHIRYMHLKLKPFTCNICQESFALKSLLRTHQVSKHEGGLPKKHLCSYCGKGFTQPKSLKDHINTHTGERPYKCDMCSDTFSFAAALFTHRRLKHLGYKWTYGKSKSKKKVVRVEPPSKKAKKIQE